MGARKAEQFPIRIMSLRAIAVDHALQSRVLTNIEYQRQFSEAMLRGAVFPPIVIFFDGKTYWLADGFHRFGAARAVGVKSIRAEVREGSRRDAMVFSAGANQEFGIPRTNEDLKKAVWMLLEDPEWWTKSSAMIGKHVGVSPQAVNRYRVDFSHSRGIPLPDKVERSDGTTAPRLSRRGGVNESFNKLSRTGKDYSCYHNGKRIYLGVDADKAKRRYEDMNVKKEAKRSTLENGKAAQFLIRKGVPVKGAGCFGSTHPGLSAFISPETVWVTSPYVRNGSKFDWKASFVERVGCVLMARQHIDPSARAVIVCYREEIPEALAEIATALGVELLNPDEFAASLKPDTRKES